MGNIEPIRIQIVSIMVSLVFLLVIGRAVAKGRLRSEYSVIWIIISLILVLLSFWRSGIEIFARWLGVYYGINLAFAVGLFATFVYLLHLSIVASKLYEQNKVLAQEMARLKEKLKKLIDK